MKQEYSQEEKIQEFEFYILDTKSRIESELAKLVAEMADSTLHDKIEFALLSKGKRLRPLLVILSAQSVGGTIEDVMSLALAVELLHTATLIHDDVIDQDKFRRGVHSVHEKWSVNDAILVGDALISLAINLAAPYGKEIIQIAAETGLKLCDGELMDISSTSAKMLEREYLEKIRKKSASLFQTATRIGAIAGGGSEAEIRCLAGFGENFGMAYQLSDDLSDITSLNGSIPRDIQKRRVSLPLIHAYNSSNLIEKENLLTNLQILAGSDSAQTSRRSTALNQVLKELKSKGSLSLCWRKINEYLNKVVEEIQPLRDTDYKVCLIQMANMLKKAEKRNVN